MLRVLAQRFAAAAFVAAAVITTVWPAPAPDGRRWEAGGIAAIDDLRSHAARHESTGRRWD